MSVAEVWRPYWAAVVEDGQVYGLVGGKDSLFVFPPGAAGEGFEDVIALLHFLLEGDCVLFEGEKSVKGDAQHLGVPLGWHQSAVYVYQNTFFLRTDCA